MHFYEANSYISVIGTEIYKFKAKDYEINAALSCLGNVSKGFSVDIMKNTGLYGYVHDFSFDYVIIYVDDVLDIPKYLIKKHDIK